MKSLNALYAIPSLKRSNGRRFSVAVNVKTSSGIEKETGTAIHTTRMME